MARIELRGVAHAYGPSPASDKDYALRPLELIWQDGGAYALLGPSGCGKTTLLNIISGLLRPTRGQVLINGVDVTAAPPQERNIAQVFQFPVIYDTMTVAENLAFPLRNRGVSRDRDAGAGSGGGRAAGAHAGPEAAGQRAVGGHAAAHLAGARTGAQGRGGHPVGRAAHGD